MNHRAIFRRACYGLAAYTTVAMSVLAFNAKTMEDFRSAIFWAIVWANSWAVSRVLRDK